ncbi:hypothetical protein [Bacillus taeanensis]|nr:hypothetical protein [Bacillus taeanensis]
MKQKDKKRKKKREVLKDLLKKKLKKWSAPSPKEPASSSKSSA